MNASLNHIMLVDDDEDDRTIFKIVLTEVIPSVKISTAENGKAALAALRQPDFTLPDLMFLDINMPVLNGFECLRELKNDQQLKNIPVMMYSTSCNEKDVKQAHTLGACLYIVKPFNLDEFEMLFKSIFDMDHRRLISPPTMENYVLDMKSTPSSY